MTVALIPRRNDISLLAYSDALYARSQLGTHVLLATNELQDGASHVVISRVNSFTFFTEKKSCNYRLDGRGRHRRNN